MKSDPWNIKKKYSPRHPVKVLFMLKTKLDDKWASLNFKHYHIPTKELADLPASPSFNQNNTIVTPHVMQYLFMALKHTEHMNNTVVVEIGSYKGETTRCLAQATTRKVIAIDPFCGYGVIDKDYEIFRNNIAGCNNVSHLEETSGEAWRNWRLGPISFVFIDALHNYANVSFDIEAWYQKLVPGGLMALHDTDSPLFAGCRRAAYDASKYMKLWANPGNLVILEKV